MMSNELVPASPILPVRASFFEMDHVQQLAFATDIANTLAPVVRERGLVTKFGGNDYVEVEGWNLMGTFLGVFPREKYVKRLQDGTWEAYVDLVSHKNDRVVGGASSICSPDEDGKKKMKESQRRSMAVTRAVGKAYRLSFSWIMTLAGIKPTPAEEMLIEPIDGPWTGSDAQRAHVRAELLQRKVDPALFRTVFEKMEGKQMADVGAVIKAVTNKD